MCFTLSKQLFSAQQAIFKINTPQAQTLSASARKALRRPTVSAPIERLQREGGASGPPVLLPTRLQAI